MTLNRNSNTSFNNENNLLKEEKILFFPESFKWKFCQCEVLKSLVLDKKKKENDETNHANMKFASLHHNNNINEILKFSIGSKLLIINMLNIYLFDP